ncbi:MAG: hypothetical protein WC980_10720 [Candidatus Brocadiia bacterium]
MTDNFVSPFIDGLSKVINCEGYSSMVALYNAEEKIILRDLAAAVEDKDLRIIQGRYRMLKHLRDLPTQTVEKYIASKNSGG